MIIMSKFLGCLNYIEHLGLIFGIIFEHSLIHLKMNNKYKFNCILINKRSLGLANWQDGGQHLFTMLTDDHLG